MMNALKSISPQWWGAIAAATAAGASVFDGNRILGGLALGGAMLYLARKASAPCCAACAGEGDHAETPVKAAAFDPVSLLSGFGQTAPAKIAAPTAAPCPGCTQGLLS